MYFRLRSSSGQLASCRSFRTSAGIELRFGPDEGAAEMTEMVASHQAARELAATWRATLTSNGAFSELHIATRQTDALRPTRRR
jgi:hypothetical protein